MDNMKKGFTYLLKKLAAASFAFLIFMLITTIISGFSLFDLSKMLESHWLWMAFYLYAIICSIIIDGLHHIFSNKLWMTLILYSVFGFLPFIFIFIEEIGFIIIAGVVGAGAALLYYIGWTVATKNKWSTIVFAFVVPILFIFVLNYDFTTKENWQETYDDNRYEASFSYFSGEHKIPINLEKGDTLSFSISFNAKNDGGWGNHFENKRGDYLPMVENGRSLEYDANKSEEYYIVVSGHRVSGSFSVDWDIVKGN